MSFFNLQEINHHHHHHHQNRVDEHDHSGGNTSSSRSYDCVFCQRGFTTAQALGGHMNIHRKDRANPTITTNKNPTNKEPNTTNNILSNKEMLLEEDNYQLEATNNDNNTGLFYSKSYLSSQNRHHSNGGSSNFEGQPLHAFLGSEKTSSRGSPHHHMLGKRIQDYDHSKDREELDLELRLGHYSW